MKTNTKAYTTLYYHSSVTSWRRRNSDKPTDAMKQTLNCPHNWNKTEIKPKQNLNKNSFKTDFFQPWNVLETRGGAGRWRLRDVVIVSAG